MRKISVALKVIGLLAPMGAHALGIGEVKLYSALNQSFNAEIPLVISGSESFNDIRVSLASPEAFSKAGIERSYILSKLHFKPIQKSDGSVVIQVNSHEGIREPFLSFLIEVDSPQGQMLREFTVLLDPPSEFNVFQPARVSERPKPLKTEASIEPSHGGKIQSTGETYGPIRRDETLWSIARQLNPDASKVSQERMLEALYHVNPEAFQNNDINLLKAGAVLNIPDMQVPAVQARRFAPVEEKANKNQSQLKLLTPGEHKADAASEVTETLRQENEALHSRLIALESEVNVLKQTLSDKDAQIAKLTLPVAVENQPVQPESSAPAPLAPVIHETPKPAEAPSQPLEEPGNRLYVLAAAMLGASLIGLLFYLKRKQKTAQEEPKKYFDEKKLEDIDDETLEEPVLKHEFEPSIELAQPEEAQGDEISAEVDPMAEADVYLGYGRHKQAEAFMLKAIEQHPDCDAYKLKLLEIYYITENLDAFEHYALALMAEGKDSDHDFWAKVDEMGKVLCPDHSLFKASGTSDLASDLMADLKRFEERYLQPIQEKQEFDQRSEIQKPEDLDEASEVVKQGDSSVSMEQDSNVLEFDVGFFQKDKPAIEKDYEIEHENLIAFESPHPTEKPVLTQDEFDFDLDLIQPLDNPTEPFVELDEEGYSDLTDMDEQETKLDLAKAYIDMGDEKTAIEILEDVLVKGNEAQKNEAQRYIAKVSENTPAR